MRIPELFGRGKPVFSFEFFLPKTAEDMAAFRATVIDLKSLAPSFVTLTYGAGGSARERTLEVAGMIQRELGLETAAHLTCITHTRAEIAGILKKIEAYGIENIVALRGDMPKEGPRCRRSSGSSATPPTLSATSPRASASRWPSPAIPKAIPRQPRRTTTCAGSRRRSTRAATG